MERRFEAPIIVAPARGDSAAAARRDAVRRSAASSSNPERVQHGALAGPPAEARAPPRAREHDSPSSAMDAGRARSGATGCGRAASVSRRRRLAPALVAKCRGGRRGDDPYLHEVRTPRLIRRGSEWRRRDPTTPAAGSSAARARDPGRGPRRARDRWGATVDRRDGVLDDSEAATGDVRMRAHRRPLAEELVATGTRPRTRDCCRTGRRWIRPTAFCRSPLMTWRPRRPKRARPRSSRCCWTGC
jgi:hypothetical protein